MASLKPALLWGSSQAGSSLVLASSSWLVSGLSPSPLVNSLLPVLGTLPLLLPLRRRPAAYGLQMLSTGLLLLLSLGQLQQGLSKTWLLLGTLLAVLLFSLGSELSQLPLQQRLLAHPGSSMRQLRLGSDLGSLLGNLLTAVLFPAVRQFPPALLLLLPLSRAAWHPAGADLAGQPAERPPTPPMDRRCSLQGLLFGSLFALLPLWVRVIGAGKCFDFAMLLVAYGLGRSLGGQLPAIAAGLRYGLMALLLAGASIVPGWGAVLLFTPLGALAAASDAQLVADLRQADPALGWQILRRSAAIGGLIGSLLMGVLSQGLGLGWALPLQLLGFATIALLMSWPTSRTAPQP